MPITMTTATAMMTTYKDDTGDGDTQKHKNTKKQKHKKTKTQKNKTKNKKNIFLMKTT